MLPRWGSGRMTPWDDRHIKARLTINVNELDREPATLSLITSIGREIYRG